MIGIPHHILEKLDVPTRQFLHQIIMMQDGNAAKLMNQSCESVELNYGVSVTMIRKFAADIAGQKDLAIKLLQVPMREAKIVASFVLAETELTADEIQLAVEAPAAVDEAEHLAKNILSKHCTQRQFLQMIKGTKWQKLAAVHTVSWAVKKRNDLANQLATLLIDNVNDIICVETAQPLIYTLDTIGQMSNEYKKLVESTANQLCNSNIEINKRIGEGYFWLFAD